MVTQIKKTEKLGQANILMDISIYLIFDKNQRLTSPASRSKSFHLRLLERNFLNNLKDKKINLDAVKKIIDNSNKYVTKKFRKTLNLDIENHNKIINYCKKNSIKIYELISYLIVNDLTAQAIKRGFCYDYNNFDYKELKDFTTDYLNKYACVYEDFYNLTPPEIINKYEVHKK